MNCVNCGAPLPTHSDRCAYCGSLNDTDMARLGQSAAQWDRATEHRCPRCGDGLLGLRVAFEKADFDLERCPKCLGIFFASHRDLEQLLTVAVPRLSEPDYRRLMALAAEGRREEWPIAYIPCPVCGNRMLRKLYGIASGVVLDWCRDHGIWLDGGELGLLARWAAAGGKAHDLRAQREQEAIERQEALLRAKEMFAERRPELTYEANDPLVAILNGICRWLKLRLR